jgi:PAS domain S-box-containing protein
MLNLSATDLYVDKKDREAMLTNLRKTGQICDLIIQAKRKNGTFLWVSMNIQFIRDVDGNVIGTEGVVSDLTERKKVTEI